MVCEGDTNAVWDEAFRGAMVDAKVVKPRVGKCEMGFGVVRGGVVWKGFKAD